MLHEATADLTSINQLLTNTLLLIRLLDMFDYQTFGHLMTCNDCQSSENENRDQRLTASATCCPRHGVFFRIERWWRGGVCVGACWFDFLVLEVFVKGIFSKIR